MQIVRNAHVAVSTYYKGSNSGLRIVVDGRFQHDFSVNSKESKMMFEMDMNTIGMIFTGGTYVFDDDGSMVDYRNSRYRGFVQSDEAVERLIDTIGYKRDKTNSFSRGVNGLFNSQRRGRFNGAMFGGEWDKFDLSIPELGSGGDLDAALYFNWSVFSDKISTSLNVKRLVCLNGMVATAPFVTYEVPIINRWEENLEIVNAGLQPVIMGDLRERFLHMSDSRATVQEVRRAHEAIEKRAAKEHISNEDLIALSRMSEILDPERNLGKVYKQRNMNDTKQAGVLPSHLTQYDVFNMLTEASSHYGRDMDSDGETQMILNRMMFDDLTRRDTGNFSLKASSDSDHRRAFFGK